VILPAIQAVVIDIPILLAIRQMVIMRGKNESFDLRRIGRLALMVLIALAALILARIPSLFQLGVGAWTIVTALDCYVAIDLYILDMSILKGQSTKKAPLQQNNPITAEKKASTEANNRKTSTITTDPLSIVQA